MIVTGGSQGGRESLEETSARGRNGVRASKYPTLTVGIIDYSSHHSLLSPPTGPSPSKAFKALLIS